MTDEPSVKAARELLAAHDGIVTSRELMDAGLSSHHVARLVARGVLLRLRRDVLVDAEQWLASPVWERHAPRARGALRSLDPTGAKGLALSHQSALAVHGVSVFDVDDLAHLCRTTSGRGHRSTGLQVHAAVAPRHVTTVDGLLAVRPAPAVLQVATRFGVPAGLVAADSALRQNLCTSEELVELLSWPALRVGHDLAVLVTRHADGRRESAGESRTAWALHLLGHRAQPQVVIRTPRGEFVARVDFLLDGVIIEFDGMGKYTSAEVLRAEKRREDALRALGYQVVRVTWAELDDLAALRIKIDNALRRVA